MPLMILQSGEWNKNSWGEISYQLYLPDSVSRGLDFKAEQLQCKTVEIGLKCHS